MNNLLSNAAGLTSGWRVGNNMNGPYQTQTKMSGVEDLIDSRLITVFDALHQLSSLKVVTGIEVPRLVVVGDQSIGKSSVLEALTRFHFPVSDKLCTTFPTRLVLRRSPEEGIRLSIEPGPSRTPSDRGRLLKFKAHLSKSEEFGECMERAAAERGVSIDIQDESRKISITDDVLVVEASGPSLPLVDLVDLPGLFQTETNEQDRDSKETAKRLVEQHIQSTRNFILLVVSARGSFHNHMGPAILQSLSKHDPGLADRVVGVITGPDQAASASESRKLLDGRLDYSNNLKHRWHAVKNQDQKERSRETLERRDEGEMRFFHDDPDWKDVPETQKGISALRKTLKMTLWEHTRTALPGLITEVETKLEAMQDRLVAAGPPRSTDEARRNYLYPMARKFEFLVGEACRGTYQDETCKELHDVGEECRGCRRFFPPFGDAPPSASQAHNLRANIRTLSRAFAFVMRECGKTKEIEDIFSPHSMTDGSKNNKSTAVGTGDDASITTQPAGRDGQLLTEDLLTEVAIKEHYNFTKAKSVDRRPFEEWLAGHVPLWRGLEPQGETSEAVYHRLFEYQSRKWPEIASKHLQAVWKAVEGFVDLALAAVCPDDEHVRRAVHNLLVKPRLSKLRKSSHRAMNDLLNCHGRGRTGFHDGFVDVGSMRRRVKNLTQRMADLASTDAQYGQSTQANELLRFVLDSSSKLVTVQNCGLLGHDLVKEVFFRKVESLLTEAFQLSAKDDNTQSDDQAAREATFGLAPSNFENIAAARVIEHVETYYEMSTMSFVGYVNTLVVENGILNELPTTIFTWEQIFREDAVMIERVAGEKLSEARKREEEERDLQTLKSVLETLKKYAGQTE